MIRLSGLHKSYRTGRNRLHVLKGIDLSIGQGELVSIMGSSGSGKSTLLNILGLLDRFDDGGYELDGSSVRGLSERRSAKIRNKYLGFVFQSFNLVPFKSAVENVALPLYYRGVGRRKRNKKAYEQLERLGLANWATHLPTEMSGGQQQRVAIARALITEPAIILADEPTGALDSVTSNEVMDVLRSIHSSGTTVIIVTHEPDIAAQSERIVRIKDGVIESDERVGPSAAVPAAADGAS